MSTEKKTQDRKEVLRQAFLKIENLQTLLREVENKQVEPIAIIGAACRLPGGVHDLESFWRVLHHGVDTVSEIPPDRWDADAFFDPDPEAVGKMYTRYGSFLSQIDQFDAPFFKIAPREAAELDPQQRLLLEVSWEALEMAGQAPEQLVGSATGVYIGMTTNDYATLQSRTSSTNYIGTYFGTGVANSIAAGRIAYVLGLRGPCMTVDTACSSSLVALHLACQSLHAEESRMALAGGVSLIMAPDSHIIACKGQMLSRDGRCKTFDAMADGYGRGEGCGIVVLKRLTDARAEGDHILGLILGSAINQDGKSAGLTAPNGLAQEDVMRAALKRARVAPDDVGYIEAHGTGTVLGDPIELNALGEVYGVGHSRAKPLWVGSVKTNLGHLEAAAGITGLMKILLTFRHMEIPPHLHFETPNPYVPWDRLPIEIATRPIPWPEEANAPTAGLSSFGFSGTNAHVILQAPPARERIEVPRKELLLLALSAKSSMALAKMAETYADFLDHKSFGNIDDVCFTANTGRSHFDCRVAVVGKTAEDIAHGLHSFSKNNLDHSVLHGMSSSNTPPPLAFLFTGQGSQAVDMGRRLFKTQPVFRNTLEHCHDILQGELAKPLLDVLYPAPGKEAESHQLVNQTGFAQPLLFAVEYALFELWKSWGITPTAVMGHSVGEFVAACAAGALSLEDGLRLISARAKLMQDLPSGGGMAAVFADATCVSDAIGEFAGTISIAAVNSPANTVIAGPEGDLAIILKQLAAERINAQKLAVSHAFHSHMIQPMLADFGKIAATMPCARPLIDMISNVTGQLIQGNELQDPTYWVQHARQPVQFMTSMQTLYNQGFRVFLEVGPHPALLGMAGQTLSDQQCVWIPTLRRGHDDQDQIYKALARLYVNGARVNWSGFAQATQPYRLPLPTYPFQRERYWVSTPQRDSTVTTWEPSWHPILGRRVAFAKSDDIIFESTLDLKRVLFLNEHRFYGTVVLPATAYLEMGQSAAALINGEGPYIIEDFNIHAPLMIDESTQPLLQTILTKVGESEFQFEIYSCNGNLETSDDRWQMHASGKLKPGSTVQLQKEGEAWSAANRQEIETDCRETLRSNAFYEDLRSKGVDYGPAFQGLADIRTGDGNALGRIHVPNVIKGECSAYRVHPALLDSCLQLVGAAFMGARIPNKGNDVFMPMSVERFHYDGQELKGGWLCGQIRSGDSTDKETFVSDIRGFNQNGNLILHLQGLHFKRTAAEKLLHLKKDRVGNWLHEFKWQELGKATTSRQPIGSSETWIVISDRHGGGHALAEELETRGLTCTLFTRGNASADAFSRNAEGPGSFVRILSDFSTIGQNTIAGIVFLEGLDIELNGQAQGAWERHPDLGCLPLMLLVQTMSRDTWAKPPSLTLVTRGAATVNGETSFPQPGQAALWGLGRVVAAEYPEFRCKLVDLDPGVTVDEQISHLSGELLRRDAQESQIALREGKRLALRLVRRQPGASPNLTRPSMVLDQSYQLEISARGVLDNLELLPATFAPPGQDEVQIQLQATGLNFRDVLNALDMYPGDPGALGNECVGRIVALGPDVQNFAIGDPVLALTPRAFCSLVNVNAALVVKRPPILSLEEAATIPMTFMTAYYALHFLGQMQAGERVLIHAGAGGVGMAAIQLALQAGAEIFATAGSPQKREVLRKMGVEFVMNSRTTDFADQIMNVTGGQGIDIVLNSLAGDFIPKSLSLLRKNGRFLELGKTDLWDQERASRVNSLVAFIPVFLGDICEKHPSQVQTMFQDLMRGFAEGRLKPLPYRTFSIQEVSEAFRFMAQAKHIGKVIVDQRLKPSEITIRHDASYLITGGLGALGLHFADWLVEKGARHLVLMGRRAPGQETQQVLDRLRASGAAVTVVQGDVSLQKDLEEIFSRVKAAAPLKGIIHAAGLVDDGMLNNQDGDRLLRVMAPKTKGAWGLHVLSKNMDLDFFVLCSAGAAIFGSPGQGNYAAANAFMDALAHYRHSIGLPALSINWGPWAKGGMASALGQSDHQRWASLGMGMIEPRDGVRALEMALNQSAPQVAVLPIDWTVFLRQFAEGQPPGFLTEIARDRHAGTDSGATRYTPGDLSSQLEAADPEYRHELLLNHVQEQILSALGLKPSMGLKPDQGFTDLGMDSLMAVEISNRLKRSLSCSLPSTLAFEHPTLKALTEYLATEVLGLELAGLGQDKSSQSGDIRDNAAKEVEALSEEDIERALIQELEDTGY